MTMTPVKRGVTLFLQCMLPADSDFCDELAILLGTHYGDGFWKLSTRCIQGFALGLLLDTPPPVASYASARVLSARAMLVHDITTNPDVRVRVRDPHASDDELAALSPVIEYRGGRISLMEIQVAYVLRHCEISAMLWRGWEGDGDAAVADITKIQARLGAPIRMLPLQMRADGGVEPPKL